MLRHKRPNSGTPTWVLMKACWPMASMAAWRIFGLLNGGCMWLKRMMY